MDFFSDKERKMSEDLEIEIKRNLRTMKQQCLKQRCLKYKSEKK